MSQFEQFWAILNRNESNWDFELIWVKLRFWVEISWNESNWDFESKRVKLRRHSTSTQYWVKLRLLPSRNESNCDFESKWVKLSPKDSKWVKIKNKTEKTFSLKARTNYWQKERTKGKKKKKGLKNFIKKKKNRQKVRCTCDTPSMFSFQPQCHFRSFWGCAFQHLSFVHDHSPPFDTR